MNAQPSQYSMDYSKCLGKGTHGMVIDCKHPKIKESLCAKIFKTDQMDKNLINRESENLMVLRNVSNPNLVKVYGVIPVPQENEFHLIMEKCNGGSLRQEIETRSHENRPFCIKEVRNKLSQIINGYKSLYDAGIIHRNIKPSKILLNDGILKISDFGLGRVIEDMTQRYPLTKLGTPAYAAPQLFFETTYSPKSDVYSLGIILYQLVFLKLPFNILSSSELMKFIKSLQNQQFECEQIQIQGNQQEKDMIRELINRMLIYNEEQRISWEELFKLFSIESQNLHQQKNEVHDEYSIHFDQILRKESDAIVYHCSHPKIKEPICVKIFKTDQMDSKLLHREREILSRLKDVDNHNLMKIYDVISYPDKNEFHIIQEICHWENLKQDIKLRNLQNRPYSLKEIINILSQIINGYRTLFQLQIIHRDLKPANILLNGGMIKIIDFEMQRVIEDMNKNYSQTKVGTPAYAAPQLFFETTYSSKSDVYSLGIILYQLVFLQLPFKAHKFQDLILFLKSLKNNPYECGEITIDCDLKQKDQIRELINRMLMYDEEQRISWEELFKLFCEETQNPHQQKNILQQIGKDYKDDKSNLEDPIFIQNSDEKPQYFNLEKFKQVSEYAPTNITKTIRLNHLIKLLLAKGHLAAQLSDIMSQLRQTDLKSLKNLNYNLLMTCLRGYQESIIQNAQGFSHNDQKLISEEFRVVYNIRSINQALVEYLDDDSEYTYEVRNKVEFHLEESISQFQFIQNQLNQAENEQTYPTDIENFHKLINIKPLTEYKIYGKWFQYFYKKYLKNLLAFDESKIYSTQFLRLLALTEMFLKIDEEYPYKKYSELDPKKVYLPEFISLNYLINIIKKYRTQ